MSNRLAYFGVVINKLEKVAPGDGFIDPKRVELYRDGLGGGEVLSLNKALTKERANMRWQDVVQQVSAYITPVNILAITTPGATANDAPTSVSFTLVYDREEYLSVVDETDNSVTLTGEAAIRRMVAKALLNNTTSNTVVYDPTPVGGVTAQYGESVARVTAGAIADSLAAAEAAITVTRVSKT